MIRFDDSQIGDIKKGLSYMRLPGTRRGLGVHSLVAAAEGCKKADKP